MQSYREWRVVDLLKTTADFFVSRHVDEPRASAELLLAHVLGLQRLELYLQHDRPILEGELERFRMLCRERLGGRPLQYIIGEQFFYGLRFLVDERVLIPRPETELLVEEALALLGDGGGEGVMRALDVGTGSGCIAITMALCTPGLAVDALDVSPGALEVASGNVRRHELAKRVRLAEADMFSPSFCEGLFPGGYRLVVSNPPYIPDAEWDGLQSEVRDFEPRLALTVPMGMECYDAVVTHAVQLLCDGGHLCFELHADGAGGVRALMEAAGFGEIRVLKDYGGHDRIMTGRFLP